MIAAFFAALAEGAVRRYIETLIEEAEGHEMAVCELPGTVSGRHGDLAHSLRLEISDLEEALS